MIKAKGRVRKIDGILYDKELKEAMKKLPDCEDYLFYFVDNQKNRNLPSLSYLFSVVLKYISDHLPDHPPTEALYRYFEDYYAPLHTCLINGEKYEYTDAKRERQNDVNDFVERVVEHARKRWGIEVPDSELKDPENREFYAQAYAQQEVDWTSFISSKNKQ